MSLLAKISVWDERRIYARACLALKPANFFMVIKQRLDKLSRFRAHRILSSSICWKSKLLAARQLISHYDRSRAEQIAFAFELQLAAGRVGKFRLDMTISLLCDEDLSCSRGSLQPGRDIDRIPQHRVVGNGTFSNIADDGLACGDARADVQMLSQGEVVQSANSGVYCNRNSFCTSRSRDMSRTCESGIGLSDLTVALRASMANSKVLSTVPPSGLNDGRIKS